MSDPQRLARLAVSYEYLVAALRLPKGSRVLRVQSDPERLAIFTLVVEHEDLPPVNDGDCIPVVNAQVRTDHHRCPVDGSLWSVTRSDGWSR